MPTSPSPRLGLIGPLGTDPVAQGDDIIRAIIDQLEVVVARLERGTAAARPAAGIVRRFYWATDTKVLSYDDGSAWTDITGVAAGGVLAGTYPNPGFAVDMATQAELDAEATLRAAHAALTGTAHVKPLVTALPGSPVDGQEIFFDAGGGVIWHFRYNAGSASTLKWEFVGGSAMFSAVAAQESRGSTSYGDLATVGPSIVLPAGLGGEWEIEFGAGISYVSASGGTATAPFYAYMTPSSPSGDIDALRVQTPATPAQLALEPVMRRIKKGPLGGTLTMQYRSDQTTGSGSTITFNYEKRWMSVRPIRVG
jgi:hypothetical protein